MANLDLNFESLKPGPFVFTFVPKLGSSETWSPCEMLLDIYTCRASSKFIWFDPIHFSELESGRIYFVRPRHVQIGRNEEFGSSIFQHESSLTWNGSRMEGEIEWEPSEKRSATSCESATKRETNERPGLPGGAHLRTQVATHRLVRYPLWMNSLNCRNSGASLKVTTLGCRYSATVFTGAFGVASAGHGPAPRFHDPYWIFGSSLCLFFFSLPEHGLIILPVNIESTARNGISTVWILYDTLFLKNRQWSMLYIVLERTVPGHVSERLNLEKRKRPWKSNDELF